MKINILLIYIFSITTTIFAQQINTCGGNMLEKEFSAEWIIGGSLIDNSVLSISEELTGFEKELPNIGLIEVNPNATKDFLTITRNIQLESNLKYRITNNMGICIMNGELDNANPFELDVKSLAAGYYLIIFSSKDEKTFMNIKKFIKI